MLYFYQILLNLLDLNQEIYYVNESDPNWIKTRVIED
jgi:hypothetical protein